MYTSDYVERVNEENYQHLLNIYPEFKCRVSRILQDMYKHEGKLMRITSSFRSFNDQKALITSGAQATSVGRSMHHYGLAVDFCFASKHPYLEDLPKGDAYRIWDHFGFFVEAHGCRWGGNFQKPDKPHVQMTYGLKTDEIIALYKEGGVRQIWAKCDTIREVPIGSEWGSVVSLTKMPDPAK